VIQKDTNILQDHCPQGWSVPVLFTDEQESYPSKAPGYLL
jgi:hypothetical protein